MILKRFLRTINYRLSSSKFQGNKNKKKSENGGMFQWKNTPKDTSIKQVKHKQTQKVQQIKPEVNWLEIKVPSLQQNNFQSTISNLIIQIQKQPKSVEISQRIKNFNFKSFKQEQIPYCIQSILYNQVNGHYNQSTPVKIELSTYLIKKLSLNSKQIEKKSEWFSKMVNNYLLSKKKQINEAVEEFILLILTKRSKLVPNSFYLSKQFIEFCKECLYGQQKKLKIFISIIKNANTVKIQQFFQKIKNSFMFYNINNQKQPFYLDQILIYHYRHSLQTLNTNELLISLMISNTIQQSPLIEDYIKNRNQIFDDKTKELVEKFCGEALIKKQKGFKNIKKHFLYDIKSQIMKKNLQKAYQIFQLKIFKQIAIQRWKKNTQFALRKFQIQSLSINYGLGQKIYNEVQNFIQKIDKQWYWRFYLQDSQFLIKYKQKLSKDTHSFWQNTFNIQRDNQIFQLQSSGKLNQISQIKPKNKQIFDLKKYLQQQYPQKKKKVEERYQKQKQMIKFCLRMDAIIQDYHVLPNKILQINFNFIKQQLSQQHLKLLENYDLLNLSFQKEEWKKYISRYLKFKSNNFQLKHPDIEKKFNIEKIKKNQKLQNNYLTIQFLQQLKKKRRDLWEESKKIVKLQQNKYVYNLILWGLHYKQPMAIYLGQKIAMNTNQVIPHQLAIKVSDLFSYRRSVNHQFLQKCKNSLKIVGSIKRTSIYSFDKDYHHIGYHQDLHSLANMIHTLNKQTPRITQVEPIIPTWFGRNEQPAHILESALKGPL